ncbi:MAG: peroxiredoxin family protein [Fimbriimonadales bacterium]|nr:peroxiredoxin family protein [Fimbriimonadales bacterium]
MNARTRRLVILGVIAFFAPIVIGWITLGYLIARRDRPIPWELPSRHPVGPKERNLAKRLETKPAADFDLEGTDGRRHSLGSLRQPVLLYFINKDCPCSIEAEPMFGRIELAYRGKASVVGVLHGSLQDAKDWANANDTEHLVLADPTGETIRAYGVPRSVYAAVIHDGRIYRMYPGYSGDMLLEVTQLLAELARTPRKRVDPSYAPKRMTSGCEFVFEQAPKSSEASQSRR